MFITKRRLAREIASVYQERLGSYDAMVALTHLAKRFGIKADFIKEFRRMKDEEAWR